jgi:hypothetical protein
VAGWFRCSLSVSRSFVCGCLTSGTMLRFHLPLIKPDVRFSRIRLSDKGSCCRPRNVAVAQAEQDKSQLTVQMLIGKARDRLSRLHLVLPT